MKKIKTFLMLSFMLVLTGCGAQKEVIDYSAIQVPADMNSAVHEYSFNFKADEFARIDGAVEVLPIVESYVSQVLKISEKDAGKAIKFSENPIKSLVEKQKDIVISTKPTAQELEQAKATGIDLQVTPVFHDALIFVTGKYNKVDELSSNQLQQIFSGEKKNWKDVGGFDSKIFVNLPNNTSLKNKMTTFMQNKKQIDSTKEHYDFDANSKLSGTITSHLTGVNSVTYSYLSAFNQSLVKDDMKVLKLDGVQPNAENIKTAKYPQIVEYFAITRRGEEVDSLGYRLRAFALTASAQALVTSLGFIGI